MKKILVTGSKGQLGSEIRKLEKVYPGFNFTYTDIEELDITKPGEVEAFFTQNQIDICINCAAHNGVDKAVDEPSFAFLLNTDAVENLAINCNKHNTLLVHFSTDYVFEGNNCLPYRETDLAIPQTVYGLSKLQGEEAAMKNSERAIVIRTSWLYSIYNHNFVKTILRLLSEKEQITVVNDQIGTPTFAGDLAKAILEILTKIEHKPVKEIYHYSNEGVASWYDFAVAIKEFSGLNCKVLPVETNQFPTKAIRPHYSVLNKTKIKTDFGIEIPYWRDSLKLVINELLTK
ncbi:MAG TPA: dTDP-4-dehydrorhamnose reductase [Bacteroidales bacterium]